MPSQTCDSNRWDLFEIEGQRLDRLDKAVDVIARPNPNADSADLKHFLKDQPRDRSWNLAIAQFIAQRANFAGNESQFQCSPHICEVFHHQETWKSGAKVFQQFVVFDDLWAATHPLLFKSLLRFRNENLLFD